MRKEGHIEPLVWMDNKIALDSHKREGILLENKYRLLPEYGKGGILYYAAPGMGISISRFVPKVNLEYRRNLDSAFLQMSFLLAGEKVIKPKGGDRVIFETGESLFFFLDSYCGKSIIYKDHLFKEVKIQLTKVFLEENKLLDAVAERGLSGRNIGLPITEGMLSVLQSLEDIPLSGNSRIIFIKAKILELLSLQLQGAGAKGKKPVKLHRDKGLLNLYALRNDIKSNLSENHTLQELGLRYGEGQQLLNDRFIKVFGMSINEFRLTEKMKLSQTLLKNTELLIYEIAERVGYKNGNHFTAAFKRFYGITPRQYRESS
ncbi:MAG: AraC family transcriptional regulator [Bacteroidota bacterium]